MPEDGGRADFTKAMSRLSPDDAAKVLEVVADPDGWPALMNLILLQQILLRDEVADA